MTNTNTNNELKADESIFTTGFVPHNRFINSFLTDLYQLTMAYAYWKNEQTESVAVFDLFFRKCPFKGEYCIFAGLDDVLRFLNTFAYTKEQVNMLKQRFPTWDSAFWDYLLKIDASGIRLYAQREGSVVFPKVPLLRVEGPVIVCQLIETTFLNLVNYASLVTTNACRIRQATGPKISLLEFGLRRAQGPDGAMSASRYSYIGGFNGTSNVLAGLLHNIPIKGTHAHSFVSTFPNLKVLDHNKCNVPLAKDHTKTLNLYDSALKYRDLLEKGRSTNHGELAAFIAYAIAFPAGFLALVDTYSTLESGIINFIAVALALYIDFGYKPIGIRLDSGDLAYLSVQTREYFKLISKKFKVPFEKLIIVASNDINEAVLYALKDQGHQIDSFGIGTHLVTCKRQPALGCVYKLVAIDNKPRIKLSQTRGKTTIPGKKLAYRLFIKTDEPVLDLMVRDGDEQPPEIHTQVVCESPFDDQWCKVVPHHIQPLLEEVWNGKLAIKPPSADDVRSYCMKQVSLFRQDYKRYTNPTPYKVSVSKNLKSLIRDLIREEMPVVTYE